MVFYQPRSVQILALVFLTGCGNSFSTEGNSQLTVAQESSYCPGTATVIGNTTRISANAEYRRYEDTASGLTSTSVQKIKFAEVIITNSQGQVVQCGETDESGDIGSTADFTNGLHTNKYLSIPRVTGSYTLRVFSRSDNAYLKASILNNPSQGNLFSIAVNFTLSGTEASFSPTLPIAPHNASLEGGAFSILDNLYSANKYLRQNTTCAFCTTFTVAPKVTVYWSPGLSPGTYLGDSTAAISFYNRTDYPGMPKGLYLLGGVPGSGGICADTDHFDKSVILHEYGHFLEHSFSKSDSPGGPHNADQVIDPRLAWSEGWSNYIQAQILGRSTYRDTIGNAACGSTYLGVNFHLNAQVSGQGVPNLDGEGSFRELANARALYGSSSYGFPYTWHAFSSAADGIKDLAVRFRNPAGFFQRYFHVIVNLAGLNPSTYDSVLQTEKISNNSQLYYALPLSLSTVSCQSHPSFQFASGAPINSQSDLSMVASNRYFQFYYDGGGEFSNLHLNYNSIDSNEPYNLNFFIYNENHILNSDFIEDFGSLNTADLAGLSASPHSGGPSGTEAISLTGKPAGFYLIKIRAASSSVKQTTQFTLTTSTGKFLCP